MSSSVGWIVLDEQHRRNVMETMALFKEPGTVDELGIGTIRDGLSEVMFPGTSVLHTRAKYLLFVPWIFDSLHRDGLSGQAAASQARKREIQLIFALLRHEQETESEVQGIIGRVARSRLKRLPSEMYWSALHRYRILRWQVSISGYCRGLRQGIGGRTRLARDEDGNLPVDVSAWAPLPEPEDLTTTATFDLSPDQAAVLKDRLDTAAPGSMLAWLIAQQPSDLSGAGAPWQHPAIAELPAAMREVVRQAEWFAGISHGAALLYNLLLAEACDRADRDALIDTYREALDEWELEGWLEWGAPEEVWSVLRLRGIVVPHSVAAFVEAWWRAAVEESVTDSQQARQLIRLREFFLKKGRARLANRRQLEVWGGSSGAGRLTYRWSSVRTIAEDIATPLAGAHDAVA